MSSIRKRFIQTSITFLVFFSITIALSQVPPDIQAYRAEPKGAASERREGILGANRVLTLFGNTGQIGHYPSQPSGVWPKGTNHSCLDGYCFLVAASVKAPGNDSIIHPLETCYREEMDRDPGTGADWGFEPLPGYANVSVSTPALSSDPASWPAAWGGRWNGMAGPDSLNASLETYFVMDDSKDAEWSRPPFNFFPVMDDSTRQGLGLRIEARGFEWADSSAGDILMYRYSVVNLSDDDYDSTAFGVFVDPGVGGTNNTGNSARHEIARRIVYAWNPSGLGVPGNWPTGYLGLVILETPAKETAPTELIGMSSCAIEMLADKGPTGTWPKNDDVMWRRMTGGFGDSIVQNSNLVIVASSGPFALKKWTTKYFSVALVFADSLQRLFATAEIARQIASLGYHLPPMMRVNTESGKGIPARFELDQNYPNPFNPGTLIPYTIAGSMEPVGSKKVKLVVYDLLGREVAVLVNEQKAPGSYSVRFDGSGLASGMYYYRIQAGDFVKTKKLLLLR